MMWPIAALFLVLSFVGLAMGIRRKSLGVLGIVQALWWLGAFASGYGVWLAWRDRAYSENWAMVGAMLVSVPYAVLVIALAILLLIFTRAWTKRGIAWLRGASFALLAFLVIQIALVCVAAR